jgi:LmeA-like phospholipid-binding
VIGKLLSSAVKLYLRSQVKGVEDLQVKIIGQNQQILQGYIPQVYLSCDRAIYQGLNLSQVQLKGADIAVNLSEVIKQKPLKLLEPVLVELQLRLDAADLQTSLDSALLQGGLSDLWQMILAAQNNADSQEFLPLKIEWQSLAIAHNQLNLVGIYQNRNGATQKLTLSTGINLTNPHTLDLSPLNITSDLLQGNLDRPLKIGLGTDIVLQAVTIESEQISCSGKIRINN